MKKRTLIFAMGIGILFGSLATAAQSNKIPIPQGIDESLATLITARSSDIQQAVAEQGYQLELPGWQTRLVPCTANPNFAVLIQFSRTENKNQSLFSVVVPRGSAPVRVVPILRQGVTPSVPTYASSVTVQAFNEGFPQQIGEMSNTNLLAKRLGCYIALSGYGDVSDGLGLTWVSPVTLFEKGKKVNAMAFRDSENRNWYFTFMSKGMLSSARLSESSSRQVPPAVVSSSTPVSTATTTPQQNVSSNQPESTNAVPPHTDKRREVTVPIDSGEQEHPVPNTDPTVRQWTIPIATPQT